MKEIDRLTIENAKLSIKVTRLEESNQVLVHEKNKSELSELIEVKFSESIAAGIDSKELES